MHYAELIINFLIVFIYYHKIMKEWDHILSGVENYSSPIKLHSGKKRPHAMSNAFGVAASPIIFGISRLVYT